MKKCNVCSTEMKLLLTSFYCPNDCDKKELKLTIGSPLVGSVGSFKAITYNYITPVKIEYFDKEGNVSTK